MYSSLPWVGNPYNGGPAPTAASAYPAAATGKRTSNGDSGGPPKRPKPNPGHRYSACFTHFSKLPLDKKKEM